MRVKTSWRVLGYKEAPKANVAAARTFRLKGRVMSVEKSINDTFPSPRHSAYMNTFSELEDLINQYLSDMPARIERLSRTFVDGDWELLNRSVHQLKGSAGSYGFPAISVAADRLETLLADRRNSPEVAAALADLIAICKQARSVREATVPEADKR
ncbi:Hpt domain protein (plasmid) [Lacipirellula limnantheis]|uniref:Hpt domain protein n=2 Tax=Lacipirellula limnantheis TaxID=2528024 RepID=A0A517U6X9_9BACT|nr:Hpt domain protein [Lacipirellula limnantheis]